MGNVVPLPSMCKEATVVQATAAGVKKPKKTKRAAAANKNLSVRADQEDEDKQLMKRAALLGIHVLELAAGQEHGMQVKVVMTRKEAAEFMARLDQRAAAARKAVMQHGGSHLRARRRRRRGETMPRQDAWRPCLTTISEN